MIVRDLGRMEYRACTELQRALLEEVAAGNEPDTLLFVEHDPVLTLGANFHEQNLRLSLEEYRERGIAVERTERGGDVTYHGPGQLVAYPIFDLKRHGRDLHKWMRDLEETVIVALRSWSIVGERFPPHTGVWVEGRKICAIGVKVRRWVSMHGIALNCDNDLAPFELIVPCGIEGYGVTSVTQESGSVVGVGSAKELLKTTFGQVLAVRA